MALRPILLAPPPPKITPKSGVDQIGELQARAQNLRNNIRLASKMGEHDAVAQMQRQLALVNAQLARLETPPLDRAASPAEVTPVTLTFSNTDEGNGSTALPLAFNSSGTALNFTPAHYEVPVETSGETRDDDAAEQAGDIFDDIAAGKSIDLIAAERNMTREEVINQLEAGGYEVKTTEPTSDNGDVRTTEVQDAEAGETVTEYHDFHHGTYYTTLEDGNGETSSPARDERGWTIDENYDSETGITTTRYEDDLGSGAVVEKTELPSGVVIEETTQPDGSTDTVVKMPDGTETTLADSQDPTREGVDHILDTVQDGKSIDEIADELGLTKEQVIAQLAAAGLEVRAWEPISDNGDIRGTEVVDAETGQVISAHYHDYHHDAVTTKYVDEDGNQVSRTEYADGTVSETVIDEDGRKTTTVMEPVNGGEPVEHEVQDNENLTAIAEQYGLTLEELREQNPEYFEGDRDPDLIYAGETVVIEDGTKTTVTVTFNGHTLTTAPDGSMTLTNHTDGTEIEIEPGSVEEGLARALLEANPGSSNPKEAQEAEIVVAAIQGLLAGQSYEELLEAAGDRHEETEAAIDEYGLDDDQIGPKAVPSVEVDENGNQVINFQGQAPEGAAPSGGAWVPVNVDGVWYWTDPEIAKAIFAENAALARLTEAQARYDELQAQLDVWAFDPAYDGAMNGAASTIDEVLGKHGLRWVRPEPEGTLGDARTRLSEAGDRLEDASGALESYERAESLLEEAMEKQADLPALIDPNVPVASAPGSEVPNRDVEYAEGLAAHAEVAALFYEADFERANGDKLSMDYTVDRLQSLLDGAEEGSEEYEQLESALEQAQELQEALGSQLEIAEAYKTFYNARSDLTDLEAQAEDIEQRLLAEYNSEHDNLSEQGKEHYTVGGDYLGEFSSQEIVERDGQLWVVNHFTDGETEQQLTYSLNEENVTDEYRERALNREWQELTGGQIDTTMCTDNRLAGLKTAELAAGRDLNNTLEEQLGVSIENLDDQIEQLQGELEDLNKPANHVDAPELPDGVEPVEIDVGGQKIQVTPEVAEAYEEIGLGALSASDQPVRIQIDTNGDGTTEWQWVKPELAYTAIALKLAQDQRTAAEETQSNAHAAANWYDFQLSQPLKLLDDAETEEYNARLQDAYLEEHESQMLDERVQPQMLAFYEHGYNELRGINDNKIDEQIASALNMDVSTEKGADALGKIKDEIRDVGGDDAEFSIVPMFYVDEAVGMQQAALFAVEDGDGKTWYIDATGKKFDSVEDFQDNNQLFDNESGKLILPSDFQFRPGENGEIALDVVDACNISTWDKVADPIIGIGAGLAGLAALIPTPASPFLAGAAYAGAAYFGAKTAYNQYNHIQHGGEWNDAQSMMNGLMIATVVLPGASSGLRTLGMGSRTLANGTRVTYGQAFLSSIGVVKPNTPLAQFAGNYMRNPGVLNRLARGLDWTAVGTGAPLMAVSAYDLAVNGHEMSGLEKASALVGLGTGLIGTALGGRMLLDTQPVKPTSDGSTIALTAPDGQILQANILGNPPKNANKVYVPTNWEQASHGNAPGTSGKTHIAVRDPGTGEITVIPWTHGASEGGPQPSTNRRGPDAELARGWSEYDIRSLKDQDIASIGDDIFPVLNATQIGAFTATQIKQFTRGQIRGISADDISHLNVGALRPEQVPWLTGDQVSGLTGRQLTNMSDAGLQAHFTKPQLRSIAAGNIKNLGVSGLTSEQVPWLTTDQTAAITGAQLRQMNDGGLQAYFTRGQLESISTVNVRKLGIGGLGAKQVPWFTDDQIGSLTPSQWRDMNRAGLQRHLTESQITNIPDKNIRHVDVSGFSKKQVGWLTDSQVGKLTLSQLTALGENGLLKHFGESQVASISGENIKRLDLAEALAAEQIPWLTRGQVKRLTGDQLEALSQAGLVAHFTENQLSGIPARRMGHVDVSKLEPTQIPWLTTEQIAKITAGQLKQLSDNQLRALTREQVEALQPEQMADFTAEQKQLIDLDYVRNLSGDDIAGLSIETWQGLGTAQMQMFDGDQLRAAPLNRMKYVRVEALNPEQIAEFTAEQVAKLTAQQLASLSTEQLAAFTSAHTGVLKPRQTALLTENQLGALNGYDMPSRLRRTLATMQARGIDTLLLTGGATGALTAMWPAIPENIRVHLHAGGFFVRGTSIIIKEVFPTATAPHTRLGRFLRAVDVITFIPNLANGTRVMMEDFQNGAYIDMTDEVTFNVANWWYSAKSLKEVATGRKAFPWVDKWALPLYLGGSGYYTYKVGDGYFGNKLTGDPDLSNIMPGQIQFVSDFLGVVPGGVDSISGILFTGGSAYLGWKAYRPGPSDAKMPRWVDGAAFGGGLLLFGLSTWAANAGDESADTSGPTENQGPDQEQPSPDGNEPEPPAEEPRPQLVVTAPDGLNIREAPTDNSDRTATLRPGSFVQETGDRATDDEGNEWVSVSGYGWDGQEYEGWVSASHVSPHHGGAQDENGRYNPLLEEQGYLWVSVQDGQSIGSIARERSADVAETVVLNMEHIQVPDLIFAGDRIYIPQQAVG